jgi:hypothetical protein
MEHKISIGVPTYNDFMRVNNLLTSIFLFTPTKFNFKVVVLDDGTPDKECVQKLKEVCDSFGVHFIEHESNKGIPVSWNDLTKTYDDCDIQILFNDDICINDKNWLDSVIYFFDNNENVGSIGWNLIQIDPNTSSPNKNYSLPNYDVPPGRVGSPVGCCFAFLREHWKQVTYPDGSYGFPELIRSFYEETWFNFEQWKRGWWSFHVPYPAQEHWGSQTFGKNAILAVTEFNDYLKKEEYINIIKNCPSKMSLTIEQHVELAEKHNLAYRMDYSRAIFAKYWGVEDFWHVPQVKVHDEILKINDFARRKIKYLDKNMKECEVDA